MGLLEYRDFGISGEDDDICIDLIEGFLLPPAVRFKNYIVPKLDGEQAGNRRKGTLVIPAAGFIRGSGSTPQERREDFLVNLTAAMAVLNPALSEGALTLSQGYLGLPVGSEATIQAVVRNAAPGRMEAGQSFQLWTFEFEALEEPEWSFGS